MSTSASTHPSPLRRLLPVASALALVLIAVGAFANVRMAPGTLTQPEAPVISAPVRLSLPDASARVAMPRELVEMEAAGLVTLARAIQATTPRELVEMEAAGLVTLARAVQAATPRDLVETKAAGLATITHPSPAAMPRELVEMEAAGLVTLARAVQAATPRDLVEMEAAGLVILARPRPAAAPHPIRQGDTGYHVWGDCTDPIVRLAAPELCM